MNIEKITELAPIFGTTGANARKHTPVKDMNKLAESGVNFDTYTIREGETLRFPKFEDMHVEELQVSPGRPNTTPIVACESEYNGKKRSTWFGLAALKKQDADRIPCQPTWYDLGNNLARLKALAAMGEIHGLRTIEIQTPVFGDDFKPIVEDVLNADGTPVIENGVQKRQTKTKTQSVVIIDDYNGE